MLYGALEAGGTKMICALGDENGKIYEQLSIPTIEPEITIRLLQGEADRGARHRLLRAD